MRYALVTLTMVAPAEPNPAQSLKGSYTGTVFPPPVWVSCGSEVEDVLWLIPPTYSDIPLACAGGANRHEAPAVLTYTGFCSIILVRVYDWMPPGKPEASLWT
jgi:hypothetical protein